MQKQSICFLLVLTFLAGCSTQLNEGLVRMAVPAGSGADAEPISAAIFSESNGPAIGPDDDFQITLISAFICDVREEVVSLDAFSFTNSQSSKCGGSEFQSVGTRAEVAILLGFRFRDSVQGAAELQERLIFFGDDVRESGQLLNLINVPAYGPAPYQLAASELRVTILELDQQEAKEQTAILETLAAAGQKFSSPVGGAVLEVLSNVGSTLLKANQDDRELRFYTSFDPPFLDDDGESLKTQAADAAEPPVFRSPLREGYIAFIRSENRLGEKSHIDFENIRICKKLGLLVHNGDCRDGNAYLNDRTWLLFRVSKEPKAVADAMLSRTLEDALQARKGAADSADLKAVLDALEALKKKGE